MGPSRGRAGDAGRSAPRLRRRARSDLPHHLGRGLSLGSYLDETARALIAFDTVSARSNVAAIDHLADEFERFGFRVSRQRYERGGIAKANLVAVAGPPRAGGLILSGHVDTVPWDGQPGWTRDALRLAKEDERVYGRGSSDMKVFVAQCLDAARELDVARLERPLVFLFTADEEVGCLGAERLAEDLAALLDPCPVPRLAWIGEPTGFEMFHAHKGIAAFEIQVRGHGGHSGAPRLGVNAIAAMGKVIEALDHLQEEWIGHPRGARADLFAEAPYATLNLGTIRGGIAGNVIAEECRLGVTIRALPEEAPDDILAGIRERLGGIDLRDGAGGERRAVLEIRNSVSVPAMVSPRGTVLEEALSAVIGRSPSGGAPFAADGCRFARLGIATILCGPGDFSEAHQPDESISRDAFERGTGVISSVIGRVCGSQGSDPR